MEYGAIGLLCMGHSVWCNVVSVEKNSGRQISASAAGRKGASLVQVACRANGVIGWEKEGRGGKCLKT